MRWLVAVMMAVVAQARAQTPPIAPPLFHGVLQLPVAGRGFRDTTAAIGRLTVAHWEFFVSPASDGIFPDREIVVLAIGTQTFVIPPGSVHRRRAGRLFSYRASRPLPAEGIRSLRLLQREPGVYAVRFRATGVDLSMLKGDVEVCVPAALIIGDDDAFSGVKLRTRTLASKAFAVPLPCDPSGQWPWLGGSG